MVAKLRRACERWTEGEKALAHIHLTYASLPPCEEEQALRLFVADELIEAGVTPRTLKAQRFDPAPLGLLKANFNPTQPRWPGGSGRESGQWSGGAGIDSAGVKEFIARLLLTLRLTRQDSAGAEPALVAQLGRDGIFPGTPQRAASAAASSSTPRRSPLPGAGPAF